MRQHIQTDMISKKNLKAFFTEDEKQIVYISEAFRSSVSNPQHDIHIVNLQDGSTIQLCQSQWRSERFVFS